MQVGDLVKYKYAQEDIGIIIEAGKPGLPPKFKVAWVLDGFSQSGNATEWMRPTGLLVISESR